MCRLTADECVHRVHHLQVKIAIFCSVSNRDQIDLKQKNEADIEQDVLVQGPGVHGEKRAGLSANSQRVTTTNHEVLR